MISVFKDNIEYCATVLLTDLCNEYEIEVQDAFFVCPETEREIAIEDPEPWLIDKFADLAIELHNSKKEDCSHRLGVK